MKWFDFKPLLDHLVVFLDKTLRTKGKAVCLTTKAYITLIRILLFIGGHHFSHIKNAYGIITVRVMAFHLFDIS